MRILLTYEKSLAKGIALGLPKEYRTRYFTTAETALESMKEDIPDLVLLDIGLPGMSGVEALRVMKKDYPGILVIMITAFEDIKTVISAMRLGAYDYVVKPIQMDTLEVAIKNALDSIKLRKEVQALQEKYLRGIQDDQPVHDLKSVADKFKAVIPENGTDLPAFLDAVEKQYIKEALRITEDNETNAARLLHYKYSTLRYRRRKFNIS